jgi:hypothetical protein
MLEAQVGEVAVDVETVTATIAAWARQAIAEQYPLRLGASVDVRRIERPVSKTALAGVADTLMDGKSLAGTWCPVLWMGSREWRQRGLVTLVLGVGGDGRRRVLSVRSGSIREQGVVTEVLSDLSARWLSVETGVLVVTEGSRIVDDALRRAWGERALVSHCRQPLLEEVASHLAEDQRAAVCAQVVDAWTRSPSDAAQMLRHLAKSLDRSAPGAAERLRRSIDASLVVDLLAAPAPLKDRLLSMGSVSQALGRARAWGEHGGELEDLLEGLNRWLLRTRRLMGWQHLGLLAHAIQEAIKRPSPPTENENCTPSSKSGAAKGTR